MPFTSLTFLLFFLPTVLVVATLGGARPWRAGVLLLASVGFYAWGEGPWVLLLLASMTCNWGLGLALGRAEGERARRLWLGAGITFNIGLLVAFKYAAFLAGTLNALLGAAHLGPVAVPSLHQPVGISFFTFQAVAYLMCIGRGETRAQRSSERAGVLLGLFPGLLAGPIVRASELDPQLDGARVTLAGLAAGLQRFVVGLGKKVLLADTLGRAVDTVFGQAHGGLSAPTAWFGVIAFALQVYLDFSGYSDMAIGLARMLGYTYPENFRLPYLSRSIAEFWTRWHMTLSFFFRDYVFLPVTYAVSRRLDRLRLSPRTETWWSYAAGTAAAMLLIGLWHGASWPFVLWGGYFALLLMAERTRVGTRLIKAAPAALRHVYVLLAVLLGWVWFKAASAAGAMAMLRAMVGLGRGDALPLGAVADAGVIAAMMVGAAVSLGAGPGLARLTERLLASRGERAQAALTQVVGLGRVVGLAAVLTLTLMWLSASTYTPFIYFQF